MCREAQVTLIELNRDTKEIRAKHQNKAQSNKPKKPTNTKHKTPKSRVRISEGLSKPKQKLSESEVRRGHEFVLLLALST